jgi:hypothetical protein
MSHWFDVGLQAEKHKNDPEGLKAWVETLTDEQKAELRKALRGSKRTSSPYDASDSVVKRAFKTGK